MNYYFLSTSTDDKVIGKSWPQCKGVPSGYNFDWYDEPDSMTKLNSRIFPDFKPNLIFELEKNTKCTDFISHSNIFAKGFLINKKVKDVFNQFNLIKNMYHDATVIYKQKELAYYRLHLVKDDFAGLDFKESIFFKGPYPTIKSKYIEINSIDDILKFKKDNIESGFALFASAIKLNKNLLNCDMFFFPFIHHDIIVSERLANALMELKITGMELKKTDIIINEPNSISDYE